MVATPVSRRGRSLPPVRLRWAEQAWLRFRAFVVTDADEHLRPQATRLRQVGTGEVSVPEVEPRQVIRAEVHVAQVGTTEVPLRVQPGDARQSGEVGSRARRIAWAVSIG